MVNLEGLHAGAKRGEPLLVIAAPSSEFSSRDT